MEQSREEWLAERRKGIGGSDWVHALGIEPYGCRLYLWLDKRNVTRDFPEVVTGEMMRGKELEHIVAKRTAEFMNRPLRRQRRISRAPGMPPWWVGNIDRRFSKLPGESSPGVWEGKTTGTYQLRWIKREIPEGHTLQIQHYMGYTGWDWGLFAYMDVQTWKLHLVPTDRNQEMIDSMLVAGDRFWARVENGPAPRKIDPPIGLCGKCSYRMRCHGMGVDPPALGPDEKDVKRIDDPFLDALIRERADIDEVVKQAGEMKDDVNARIKEHLGKHGRVMSAAGKVYWTMQPTSRFQKKELAAKHPQLVAKFTKESSQDTLRIYPFK